MSPRMRSPDSTTLHFMRGGKAYSYLHYVYYQVGGAMHILTMATVCTHRGNVSTCSV